MTRPFPPLDALVAGIHAGDRTLIGRALTLVESKNAAHREQARALLARLAPDVGRALRVGITGVPGVGKSTLIDALGVYLISKGLRVAVLAVDPSSERSGGSILGDKTRMARLSVDPAAFIRPSPSGGTLGGVASRTREAMSVLEAAGFDVVLVETVGVGQSETAVRQLTDTFVLLTLAGAGDELQGIKRGIMELADVVLVTKADGDNALRAERAAVQLRFALRLLHGTTAPEGPDGAHGPHGPPPGGGPPQTSGLPGSPDARHPHGSGIWHPPVITTSATLPRGLDEAWDAVLRHRELLVRTGHLEALRHAQARHWMWRLVEEGLRAAAIARLPSISEIETSVARGQLTVEAAASRIVAAATAR